MKRLHVLDAIEQKWLDCQRCSLSRCRTRVVHWRGNPQAPIFVIGEAPGENEDRVGRPFVGRAGRLLDEAMREAGVDPTEDVFVTNQVACRPPGNRTPEHDEIKACASRLHQLLRVVRPRVLLLLGATAAKLAGAYSVKRARGVPTDIEVLLYNGDVRDYQAVVTFHPSYVLRTGGAHSESFDQLVRDVELCKTLLNN